MAKFVRGASIAIDSELSPVATLKYGILPALLSGIFLSIQAFAAIDSVC